MVRHMVEKINQQLKDFLKSESKTVSKEKSKYLALISMTVYRYMDYMMEELEKAGFTGIEYLEKCELFLKCVTSSYSRKSFDQLLQILEGSDPLFKDTKFYFGIKALRALCTGEGVEKIEIMKGLDHFENVSTQDLGHEVVFFTTFLIENVQRYLRHFRTDKSLHKSTIAEYKHKIGEEFDACVVGTVLSIGQTSSESAAMAN